MDLLVLADPTGAVDMTLEAISRRTNVPIAEVTRYINELCQPDVKSRSQLEEGKRLVPLDSNRDWGWQIVNYGHYRKLRDQETMRSYFRDAMRKSRSKQKEKDSTERSRRRRRGLNALNFVKDALNTSAFISEWKAFLESRNAKRKPVTKRAAELLLNRLAERPDSAVAALQMAIENNWTGFKWHWFDQQNAVEKNGSGRQMSAFEIEKRTKAISEEISKIWKRNGNKRVEGDGITELKKRREELHKQLTQ